MLSSTSTFSIFISLSFTCDTVTDHLSLQVHCDDDEYEIDCRLYSLDYRIIDGDVSLPQNSFQTSKFLPNGKCELLCQVNMDGERILWMNGIGIQWNLLSMFSGKSNERNEGVGIM